MGPTRSVDIGMGNIYRTKSNGTEVRSHKHFQTIANVANSVLFGFFSDVDAGGVTILRRFIGSLRGHA